MPFQRVGKDVDAAHYWAERGKSYESKIDGPYHAHRLAVIKRLLRDVELRGKLCLDFGCGDGVMMSYLAERGASITGLDPSEELVQSARKRLAEQNIPAAVAVQVSVGGVEALRQIEAGSVDCLLALNVLAYFSDSEEQLFYQEAARIVRRGGSMVITHSNELFDMYTFNAYTVEFYQRHLTGQQTAPQIAPLLTNANKPERITFNIRENPLHYRYKLAAYGFEETQQEFANLHPLPPLLMDSAGFADIDQREYTNTLDWPEPDRWKLMFMCSMYGSRSNRK